MGESQITLYYVKFSLHVVASAVNLNCEPQTSVCDGDEVVCNCTAPCSEAIFWWDNQTISFCSRTLVCVSGANTTCSGANTLPPVHVEVINCSSTGTFTSRLSYNASLSTSRNIQIGCLSSRINDTTSSIYGTTSSINGTTCSPEELLDSESVTLQVRNCTGIQLDSAWESSKMYRKFTNLYTGITGPLPPPTWPGKEASMIQQYTLWVAIRYIYQITYNGTLGGIMSYKTS